MEVQIVRKLRIDTTDFESRSTRRKFTSSPHRLASCRAEIAKRFLYHDLRSVFITNLPRFCTPFKQRTGRNTAQPNGTGETKRKGCVLFGQETHNSEAEDGQPANPVSFSPIRHFNFFSSISPLRTLRDCAHGIGKEGKDFWAFSMHIPPPPISEIFLHPNPPMMVVVVVEISFQPCSILSLDLFFGGGGT